MVTFTDKAQRFMRYNRLTPKYVMNVLSNPESTFRQASTMVHVYGYGWCILVDLNKMRVLSVTTDTKHERWSRLVA